MLKQRIRKEEAFRLVHNFYCDFNRALHGPEASKWELASEEEKSIAGGLLQCVLDCPRLTARGLHELYFIMMDENGWTYANKMDGLRKEHPSITHWENLTIAQQAKAEANVALINILRPFIIEDDESKASPCGANGSQESASNANITLSPEGDINISQMTNGGDITSEGV